jgi:hypothetical protein
VGVAVGDWQKVETDAGAAPPPDASSSRAPKRPLVLMFVDWLALSWKELEATGAPFRSRVQMPAPVMLLPMSVIVNVP